jgi:hypothetical protein
MNDQDHSLSLSDPDRSLVLSHLLVNFLINLASCQTGLRVQKSVAIKDGDEHGAYCEFWRKSTMHLLLAHFCGFGKDKKRPGLLETGLIWLMAGVATATAQAAKTTKASFICNKKKTNIN